MTIKKLISGEEAKKSIYNGLSKTADIVSKTAGPGGRTILIQQQWGGSKTTKDGVSVVKAIQLPAEEGEGAKLLIEAAEKTGNDAGDGTTVTCIIANAIASEGMRVLDNKTNVSMLKKGIDTAIDNVVKSLKEKSIEITKNDEIKQIATISANNDTEIGELIAEGIEKVGKLGILTVEKANGIKNELEVVDGMEIDQGYMSPYFMTNLEKSTCEFDDVLLFLYDGKIINLKQILPLLEEVSHMGRPIVFFVEDFDDAALGALIQNHIKGTLRCCVVKAPSFGDLRKDIMEDVATLTGGQFISEKLGMKHENVNSQVLGSCKHIRISQTNTLIVDGNGEKTQIDERVKQLQEQIANTESSYDKEKYQERLAKLTSGCAIIKVGAKTEVELNEKKDRVDDAICATKAALEEGILPGGGISLLKIWDKLPDRKKESYHTNEDYQKGIEIVRKALRAQFDKIVENAGYTPEIVYEKVKDKEFEYGFNALTGAYGNMYEMGVIDPTKVLRCALQNGSSVAGTLLTTDGLIIDNVEEIMKLNALAKSFQGA